MKMVPFLEAFTDVSRGNKKIPGGEMLQDGKLPVVDQGSKVIAGYTNDLDATVKSESPLIVFGDHTKIFKLIHHKFAMGADGIKLLKPSAGLDASFAFHYLRSIELPNAGYSRHYKFLKESLVPLPPLDEQRRIAATLDKADAICQKRRQAIAHLDTLAQSIFHSMFILEDRKWVELREVCSVSSGGTPSKKEKNFWNGSIPWFSLKDLKKDFLTDSIDHVTEQSIQQTSLRILHKDTILVGVRGMILAHTIPISLLRAEGAINQDIKALHSDASTNAEFLHAALKENHNHLLSRVTTAAHGTKRLETDVLLSAQIPCASTAEQNEFSSKSDNVRLTRNRVELAAKRAEQLFASLQSQAFRGLL